jgi:hypothetical protein
VTVVTTSPQGVLTISVHQRLIPDGIHPPAPHIAVGMHYEKQLLIEIAIVVVAVIIIYIVTRRRRRSRRRPNPPQ